MSARLKRLVARKSGKPREVEIVVCCCCAAPGGGALAGAGGEAAIASSAGGGPLLSTIGLFLVRARFGAEARGALPFPLPRAESFFPATSPSASLLRAWPGACRAPRAHRRCR
ncbi:MAG: hypothetical protein ACRECM_06545 [Methyloceanibacter sp.]